jgi:hypothetical protein
MRQHFRILKIAFMLFYMIQNKSEKNIHAMKMHTCKSKPEIWFLGTISTTALTRFYKSSSSSISSFSSVETYLISFSFEDVTCTPLLQFLYGFSLFQRIFFLRLGGAVAPPRPPSATPLPILQFFNL